MECPLQTLMMQTAKGCTTSQHSQQRAWANSSCIRQQGCSALFLKPVRQPRLQCSAQKSVSPFQSSSIGSKKPAESQAVQQQQQAQELQVSSSSWQQGMTQHKWQWRDSSINYVVSLLPGLVSSSCARQMLWHVTRRLPGIRGGLMAQNGM